MPCRNGMIWMLDRISQLQHSLLILLILFSRHRRSIGVFNYFFLYSFSVIPGGLRTLEPDYIKANVQRRIDYEMGPIEGLASKYDYEKNEWKK